MKENKKVLVIRNKINDFISDLVSQMGIKISEKNSCDFVEIDKDNYLNEYGNIEIPSIILIRDNKKIDVITGFQYLSDLPKF
jgi:hypothetical protein